MDITEVARMGAAARHASMSDEQRSDAARKAARAKWKRFYEANPEKRQKKAKAGK